MRAERDRYGLPVCHAVGRGAAPHLAGASTRGGPEAALEVQCGRYVLSELEAIAGENYQHTPRPMPSMKHALTDSVKGWRLNPDRRGPQSRAPYSILPLLKSKHS